MYKIVSLTGLKLQIKTTLLCMGPFLIIPCIHVIIVKKILCMVFPKVS